ncbi:MAG: hypothetical protein GY847_34870 [Proteobacteria bacterium]|nr:hypothetical protein [Pseudomonadota bacterium]
MASNNKKNGNEKRTRGRPLKGAVPRVPWDDVDSLIVNGETIELENGTTTAFPSFREIGERYGVSHSLIAKYSRQHNCLRRRKQMEKRVHEMADLKLADFRSDELAIRKDDMIRAIDKFLLKFEQALCEDRVRVDNPTDYNTMVRLKAFILGDADSRQEHVGDITLEDLARRHADAKDSYKETTPEMRGEVIKFPKVVKEEDVSENKDKST